MKQQLSPLEQQRIIQARATVRANKEIYGIPLLEAKNIIRAELGRVLLGGSPVTDRSEKYAALSAEEN